MLDKMMSRLKLRITLRTFKIKIHELEVFTREEEIWEQNKAFSRRLEGMKHKENKRKENEIEIDLKGIQRLTSLFAPNSSFFTPNFQVKISANLPPKKVGD